ncbi:MAG TPA: hypothetical protein VF824_21800 [Thermoanaerobaculia bacterium]|jgi:hypothetical protein
MLIAILQTALLPLAGLGLYRLWQRSARTGPWIALFTAIGFLARAGFGLLLFWLSYLPFRIPAGLEDDNGFWFYAWDARTYFRSAASLADLGLKAILEYPSQAAAAFFVKLLALFITIFGPVAPVGLLVNLLAYLGTCAVLVALFPRSTRTTTAAVAALSLSPSLILWTLQPLKDVLFLFLVALFVLCAFRWQQDSVRARMKAVAAILLVALLYGMSGIRWYFAFLLLVGSAVFFLLSLTRTRAPFRMAAASIALFPALIFAFYAGGGAYIPPFLWEVVKPATSVHSLAELPAALTFTVTHARSGFKRTAANTDIDSGDAAPAKPAVAAATTPPPAAPPAAIAAMTPPAAVTPAQTPVAAEHARSPRTERRAPQAAERVAATRPVDREPAATAPTLQASAQPDTIPTVEHASAQTATSAPAQPSATTQQAAAAAPTTEQPTAIAQQRPSTTEVTQQATAQRTAPTQPVTQQATAQRTTTVQPATQQATAQRTTTTPPATQQATAQHTATTQPATQQATAQRTTTAQPATQQATAQRTTTTQPSTQQATAQRTTTAQPSTQQATAQRTATTPPATAQRTATAQPATQQATAQRTTTAQPSTQQATAQRTTTAQSSTQQANAQRTTTAPSSTQQATAQRTTTAQPATQQATAQRTTTAQPSTQQATAQRTTTAPSATQQATAQTTAPQPTTATVAMQQSAAQQTATQGPISPEAPATLHAAAEEALATPQPSVAEPAAAQVAAAPPADAQPSQTDIASAQQVAAAEQRAAAEQTAAPAAQPAQRMVKRHKRPHVPSVAAAEKAAAPAAVTTTMATPAPAPAPAPAVVADETGGAPAFRDEAKASPVKQLFVGMSAMVLPRTIGEALGFFRVGGGGGRAMWLFVELDTLYFDAVLLFAFLALYTALRGGAWRNPALLLTVLTTGVIAAMLAYTITNFGTLFRHRGMVFIGLVLIPMIVAAERARTNAAAEVAQVPENQ